MERFTAAILHKAYGNILTPHAELRVPFGWHSIVKKMLQRLHDLPTATRAMMMVTGISINRDGLLDVEIISNPGLMPDGGLESVEGIVSDARNECAWTCVKDHRPAWIVHTGGGFPRPLCPECQQSAGVYVECARA